MKPEKRTWAKIPDGRYAERTLPELLFLDPNFFFETYPSLVEDTATREEAIELYTKARNIRIPPDKDGSRRMMQCEVDMSDRRFMMVFAVHVDNAVGEGCFVRKLVMDLGLPFEFNPSDQFAGTRMVSELKCAIFNNYEYHMTRPRCEAFYSDDGNFVLSAEDEILAAGSVGEARDAAPQQGTGV